MKRGIGRATRIIALIIWLGYLVFLGYLLFVSDDFGRIAEGKDFSYNLIPFKEILRYIIRSETIGAGPVAVNLLGNIAAFLPMGVLLPIIFPMLFGHPYRVALTGALISFGIEMVQLITRLGCCDIDDVILNTAGMVIGYFMVVGFVHRKETEDAI